MPDAGHPTPRCPGLRVVRDPDDPYLPLASRPVMCCFIDNGTELTGMAILPLKRSQSMQVEGCALTSRQALPAVSNAFIETHSTRRLRDELDSTRPSCTSLDPCPRGAGNLEGRLQHYRPHSALANLPRPPSLPKLERSRNATGRGGATSSGFTPPLHTEPTRLKLADV